MAKMGRPPLEAFKRLNRQMCLRLTNDENTQLANVSQKLNINRTAIIRMALEDFYKKELINGN